MVPHRCFTLVWGPGGGLVGQLTWPCGARWTLIALSVIRVSWRGPGSWPVVIQGIGKVMASRVPGCLKRARQSLGCSAPVITEPP